MPLVQIITFNGTSAGATLDQGSQRHRILILPSSRRMIQAASVQFLNKVEVKQFHESIGSLNDASSSFPILSTLTGNCPTLNSEGVLHGTPGCQLEVRLLIRSEVYFSPLPKTGCQNVTVPQQNWFDCVTLYSWYSQPPSSIGLEARKEAGEAVLKAEW